jgi:hypothetical protein
MDQTSIEPAVPAPSPEDFAFATRQQVLMLAGFLAFAVLLLVMAGTVFGAGGGGCGGG